MAEENAEEAQEAAAAEDGEGGEGGKKSKKKLFIIIGAAAVLVLGGGGAAMFLLGGSSDEKPAAEASAEGEGEGTGEGGEGAEGEGQQAEEGGAEGDATAEKEEEEDKDDESESGGTFGSTYTFKTFHLNLGNPLENHYIRLEIAVEYKGGEDQKGEIEQRLPQLRDAVVAVTSRKTREFLLGPDGKDQLRREILIRMNRYMKQPLESVFLTDILIE